MVVAQGAARAPAPCAVRVPLGSGCIGRSAPGLARRAALRRAPRPPAADPSEGAPAGDDRVDVNRQLTEHTRENLQKMADDLVSEAPASFKVERILDCPDIRSMLEPRPSPFMKHDNYGSGFVHDSDLVAMQAIRLGSGSSTPTRARRPRGPNPSPETDDDSVGLWARRAGARETIFWDPPKVKAAIVTCGGLCPGLNDVVYGLVNKLESYGVPSENILGIRYGFSGFYDQKFKPIPLSTRMLDGIHLQGGTILGTSRGKGDMAEIIKRIDMWGINQLYVVGGNGGNAGAHAIDQALREKDIPCCVVGLPKSIDNDILLIDKTFGFDTAVEEAQRSLLAAKTEAVSAYRGLGLVKVMGRQSGFVAMQASLASGVADLCLIPEVPFRLDGPGGVIEHIEHVLSQKGHCVVCVAEGAGQEVVPSTPGKDERDASGNIKLKDIGKFLKSEFRKKIKDVDIKYIDPTYMIRAIPTNSNDRIYCKILAHNAVHAAMAGYTDVTVGLINTHYAFINIPALISSARTVDPRGKMWNRLRHSIGQPSFT
ncbi:unnamed protein product [Pedinophyceae sp. YPF-701]|nr:unnamed protein product [Pedinophyceae sp. YPF-701]